MSISKSGTVGYAPPIGYVTLHMNELVVEKRTQTVIESPIATLFFRSSLHFFVPKIIMVRSSANSITKPDMANIPESLLPKCQRL